MAHYSKRTEAGPLELFADHIEGIVRSLLRLGRSSLRVAAGRVDQAEKLLAECYPALEPSLFARWARPLWL